MEPTYRSHPMIVACLWSSNVCAYAAIVSLFCRIYSLLQGSFAKETCNFKEPTNRNHPMIVAWLCSSNVCVYAAIVSQYLHVSVTCIEMSPPYIYMSLIRVSKRALPIYMSLIRVSKRALHIYLSLLYVFRCYFTKKALYMYVSYTCIEISAVISRKAPYTCM